MKGKQKTGVAIAALMAGILLVGAGITALTGGGRGNAAHGARVVTTTYSLYVAADTVLAGVPGVTVENLTGAATGCLHDYQLSPANRITLERADLILLNGGGAEAFLEDVLPTLTAPVCDTGEGVDFLPAGHDHHHDDDHDHEDHDHDDHDDHDHEDDHSEVNEHIWTSPTRYGAQVERVTAALAAQFPAYRATIEQNGAAYRQRIAAIGERMRALSGRSGATGCIIFHDSLAYIADELGLPVIAAFSVGEESGVSAADLATAQAALTADPTLLVLYDSQYTQRYPAVDRLAGEGRVLTLNTAVKGAGRADDWLTAMEENLALFGAMTEETR